MFYNNKLNNFDTHMTGLFITTALKNVAVFCVLIWNYVQAINGKVIDNFIVSFHLQKINIYANVLVVHVCVRSSLYSCMCDLDIYISNYSY